MSLSCRVATTKHELDDALRVRYAVFGKEERLLEGPVPPAPREVDCFDTLETTVHLVVYANDTPVATVRLLLPNPEVARTTGGVLGIDLEQKLDLSGVGGPGLVFAESTRFCILKEWRHSEVLMHLQAGLYKESRRHGVTHWIAAANMETDVAEDARIVYQLAAHQGLVSPRWHVAPREDTASPSHPTAPLYTPSQRARAQEGKLEGLRMPRVLSLFARKMGARFIAEPLYNAGFQRFTLPLIAVLEEIPPSTLAHFEALDEDASHAA